MWLSEEDETFEISVQTKASSPPASPPRGLAEALRLSSNSHSVSGLGIVSGARSSRPSSFSSSASFTSQPPSNGNHSPSIASDDDNEGLGSSNSSLTLTPGGGGSRESVASTTSSPVLAPRDLRGVVVDRAAAYSHISEDEFERDQCRCTSQLAHGGWFLLSEEDENI